jgi:hypothetical protein
MRWLRSLNLHWCRLGEVTISTDFNTQREAFGLTSKYDWDFYELSVQLSDKDSLE